VTPFGKKKRKNERSVVTNRRREVREDSRARARACRLFIFIKRVERLDVL